MSDQKQSERTRRELEVGSEGPQYQYQQHQQHQPYPPRVYSAPPQHMAAYAAYPPPPQRQQYGYPPNPYPPPYGHRMGPGDHHIGSPPIQPSDGSGFHPPAYRYPTRDQSSAVTPESSRLVPAEFISPESSVKRGSIAATAITPSKKARKGMFSSLLHPIV